MSEDNLKNLTTKLAKDKGYAGGSPTDSGLRGFVCPRANAYGGREGIIPPGVAVQKGLVPRGMKQVSVADTAKAANAARDDGKTEAERYLEYYGSQTSEPSPKTVTSPVAQPAPTPTPPPTPSPDTIREDGMFSPDEPASGADDTLDGFYDGLKGTGFGTNERPARSRRRVEATPVVPAVSIAEAGNGRFRSVAHDDRPVRAAGMDFGHEEPPALVESENGRIRSVTPVERPPRREVSRVPENDLVWRGGDDADLHSPAYRRMAEELAQYKQTVDALYRKTDEQAAELERLRTPRKPERASETIRIVLSQEEEKLKVGGRGWECRIMGAVHRSRTGDEFVLTVSDPSYASELIASIVPGPVAVLSESGRTDCAYRGDCVKIYGEPDSADFIACFRLVRHEDA